jgi:hypothetical protein
MDYRDAEELERRLERAKQEARMPLYEKYPRLVWGTYVVCGLLLTGVVLGIIHHYTRGG